MRTPITVRVVAMSDKGFFVAVHEHGYSVFSLANPKEVKLGDRLRGDFFGPSAATFEASNLTRPGEPRIELKDWESSLDRAITHLLEFGSPECVHAGSKRIALDSGNVISQLQDEILRS